MDVVKGKRVLGIRSIMCNTMRFLSTGTLQNIYNLLPRIMPHIANDTQHVIATQANSLHPDHSAFIINDAYLTSSSTARLLLPDPLLTNSVSCLFPFSHVVFRPQLLCLPASMARSGFAQGGGRGSPAQGLSPRLCRTLSASKSHC
jgi:hypothetical protein